MNTYTQILYQIIFTAKNHEKTLTARNRPELYKYIWVFLKTRNVIYTVSVVFQTIFIL